MLYARVHINIFHGIHDRKIKAKRQRKLEQFPEPWLKPLGFRNFAKT